MGILYTIRVDSVCESNAAHNHPPLKNDNAPMMNGSGGI
jgi:hypothetical protein